MSWKYMFFSFIFISWRLITLQYCSGFCYTLTWISHGFTCVPHPDPPSHLPLYLIPLGLPSAPGRALVSCIQPGLVICFTLDNIHVSMLLSRNIPPSPSPTESKSLFCTSRRMDKEAAVHIHHGILLIKKNSSESVLMRWMKLEPIIQSEVSQKDKDHYSILTHVYGI